MKAWQLVAPREFRRLDIDPPTEPGPGEALVQTHTMGICGTDVSCYLGKFPFFDYPRIPGHELGVEVLALGSGVTNVKVGDRCSVEPYMNCGSCFACRSGAPNCCAALKVIGVMTNGGLCDRFLVRAEKLHRSMKLNFEQLALVETLAIGCHATDRGAPNAGDHVLIVGAGPIGLATLEFSRLTGARITVMDLAESRLQFCRDNYAIENIILAGDIESALNKAKEITGGDLFKIVTDATGNARSMSGALSFVAPTGTLVYVGITTEEVSFKHPSLHRPEMTIRASRNALPADFARIIALIEDGTIDTTPWVTHRIDFDDVADEFPTMIDPASKVLKAMINIQTP